MFQAWNALVRIKTPSPLVVSITRELRSALSDMGFRIEKNAGAFELKPKVLNTNGRSLRQTP